MRLAVLRKNKKDMNNAEPLPIFLDDNPKENLRDDNFAHKTYSQTLLEIVLNTKSSTIGLFGSWGAGKTSIINDLKSSLVDNNKYKVAVIDLWKVRNVEFRKFFLQSLDTQWSLNTNPFTLLYNELKQRVKGRDGFFLLAILLVYVVLGAFRKEIGYAIYSISSHLAGGLESVYNLIPAAAAGRFFWVLIQRFTETEYKPIESSSDHLNKFQEVVLNHKYIKGKQIVIVFDNLDRCAPELVLEVFAELKTYLEVKNCTYIIPTDKSQLAKYLSKDKTYLNEDVENYLAKVFNISLKIEKLNNDEIEDYIDNSITSLQFLSDLKPEEKINLRNIIAISYSNTPREIKRFINMLQAKILKAKNLEGDSGFIFKLLLKDIPFLAKLTVIEDKCPVLFNALFSNRYLYNDIEGIYTGRAINYRYHDSYQEQFTKNLEEISDKGVSEAGSFNIKKFFLSTIYISNKYITPFIHIKHKAFTKAFQEEYFDLEEEILNIEIDSPRKIISKIASNKLQIIKLLKSLLEESYWNRFESKGLYKNISNLWKEFDNNEDSVRELYKKFLVFLNWEDNDYLAVLDFDSLFSILEAINVDANTKESLLARTVLLMKENKIKLDDLLPVIQKHAELFKDADFSALASEIGTRLKNKLRFQETTDTEKRDVDWVDGVETSIKFINENFRQDITNKLIDRNTLLIINGQFQVSPEHAKLPINEYNKILIKGLERKSLTANEYIEGFISGILSRSEFLDDIHYVVDEIINNVKSIEKTFEEGDAINLVERLQAFSNAHSKAAIEILKLYTILSEDYHLTEFTDRFKDIFINQFPTTRNEELIESWTQLYKDKNEEILNLVNAIKSRGLDDLKHFIEQNGKIPDENNNFMNILEIINKITKQSPFYLLLNEYIAEGKFYYSRILTESIPEKIVSSSWDNFKETILKVDDENKSKIDYINTLLNLFNRLPHEVKEIIISQAKDKILSPDWVTALTNNNDISKDVLKNILDSLIDKLSQEPSNPEREAHIFLLEKYLQLLDKQKLKNWFDYRIAPNKDIAPNIKPLLAKFFAQCTSIIGRDKLTAGLLAIIPLASEGREFRDATIREVYSYSKILNKNSSSHKSIYIYLQTLNESDDGDAELYKDLL